MRLDEGKIILRDESFQNAETTAVLTQDPAKVFVLAQPVLIQIKRLLNERPKAVGLAVPGMPVGSPGMEGARVDAYSVLLFDESGHSSVYARYPSR